MKKKIEEIIQANIDTTTKLLKSDLEKIEETVSIITKALKNGNKLLIFGNGGSAADAQHIAAEFINKFRFDRDPLPAIALTTDSSILTCISNDSSFSHIFEKQIKALGNKGDIALAITTSDSILEENAHSSNIGFALAASREKGITTIGFVSEKSKTILDYLDHYIKIPSSDTPRIQEAHILVGHIICELVEQEIFH